MENKPKQNKIEQNQTLRKIPLASFLPFKLQNEKVFLCPLFCSEHCPPTIFSNGTSSDFFSLASLLHGLPSGPGGHLPS